MVIVTTRTGKKRGPRFLVDLRNGLIYMDENDEWVKIPLRNKGKGLTLEPGKPFPERDLFGVLEDLIIDDATQYYNGPHPEGTVRCSCGVLRDESGFCIRCHDEQCHVCNKPLIKGLCKDPSHNPTQVPHGRTKPLVVEPLPPRKPHKWPDKIKQLPRVQRKVINNFFSDLMGVDRLDKANWRDECSIQNLPKFVQDFKEMKTMYKDDGPLSER